MTQRKFKVISDIQNVFKESETIYLKELCEDGIHLYELDDREVYMSPFEVEEIIMKNHELLEDIATNPNNYKNELVDLINKYELDFVEAKLDYDKMRIYFNEFKKIGYTIEFDFNCEITEIILK